MQCRIRGLLCVIQFCSPLSIQKDSFYQGTTYLQPGILSQ